MAGRIRTPTILVPEPGGPRESAHAQDDINRLLLAANYHEGIPPQFASELDHALTLLSAGAPIHPPRHWPLRQAITFDNLARYVQSGYHLRRCPECQRWFLATDGRRRLCYWAGCTKAATRARVARARRREHEQQVRARARVTLKRTARSK
jgi:hypothetical protein